MEKHGDRLEYVAGLAALAVLTVASVMVLLPFIAALMWGLILAIATWPTLQWLERRLGERRWLAAAVMTLSIAGALLVPLLIVGSTLTESIRSLAEQIRILLHDGPPGPPDAIRDIPLIGERVAVRWQELAVDTDQLMDELARNVRPVSNWLLARGASLGWGILELILSLVTAYFLYQHGSTAAKRFLALCVRLAGERAHGLIVVAQNTLKGVVYGITGTAIAQGTLAGFGFWVAGIPGALFLGLITFFLSVIPFAPAILWLPAAIWLFSLGETGWGIFLIAWNAIVVSNMENVIRPYFVARGSPLPVLLVFLGILGGIMAFGLLGVFLGPTLLAIGYVLITEWASEKASGSESAAP